MKTLKDKLTEMGILDEFEKEVVKQTDQGFLDWIYENVPPNVGIQGTFTFGKAEKGHDYWFKKNVEYCTMEDTNGNN